MNVHISGSNLSAYDVYQVAVNRVPVTVDERQMEKVQGAFNRIQEWGAARKPIYGVNTGFGELVNTIIPPQYKSALQRNLLLSHAAGGGDLFEDEVVRAIMCVRINCLSKGFSGVSPQAIQLLQTFLNRGIHPVIPQQGSLGASGDLAPLSHMALPLIGQGYVRLNGAIRPAGEVLCEYGLEPLQLGFKEALALINGTSAMTGLSCLMLIKATKLLQLAILGSVDFLQCMGGSTRAFDVRGHQLKNHAGQIHIADTLSNLLGDSTLTWSHADIMREIDSKTGVTDEVVHTDVYLQNAYTLRCIPQILGPVMDTLAFCRRLVEEEVNSCNDNPLIFDSAEDTFHGGNFHGQYVAMASDFLNIAITEIGVLAERQVNRLLDPHLNSKLPDFLAYGDSGLYCGYEGGQYLATSIASENLDLAAPASVKSIPSNGSNQDVVSMGLIAARKTLRLTENVTTILSVLVGACFQASHFIGADRFNAPIRELHEELAKRVALYKDDTPLSDTIATIRSYLTSPRAWELLDSYVPLECETITATILQFADAPVAA